MDSGYLIVDSGYLIVNSGYFVWIVISGTPPTLHFKVYLKGSFVTANPLAQLKFCTFVSGTPISDVNFYIGLIQY